MSLINQMLQDLEKRKAEGKSEELSPAQYMQYGDPLARSSGRSWKFAILVLVIIGLAYLAYRQVGGRPSSMQTNGSQPPQRQAELGPEMAQLPLLLRLSTDISTPKDLDSRSAKTSMPVDSATPATSISTSPSGGELQSQPSIEKRVDRAGEKTPEKLEIKQPDKQTEVVAIVSKSSSTPESVQTSVQTIAKKDEGAPSKLNASDKPVTKLAAEGNNASAMERTPAPAPVMVKEVSPQQKAESEFKQATVYQQQGRNTEAIQALQRALILDQTHMPARQLLVSLMLDSKRYDDAMRELRAGLALDSHQVNFAMVLARILVERAKLNEAVEVLQKSAAFAQDRPDYLAFIAALQQKLNHHKEAIAYYRLALERHSQNGVWWMGLGISLQADGHYKEAIEAFQQAKVQPGLGADLIAFVDQRISQLQK